MKEIYIIPNEKLYSDIEPYHEQSDTLYHFEMTQNFCQKYHITLPEFDSSYLEREGFMSFHIDYYFKPTQVYSFFPSVLSPNQYKWLLEHVEYLKTTDFHADILIGDDYFCTDGELEESELKQCLNYIEENCLPNISRK